MHTPEGNLVMRTMAMHHAKTLQTKLTKQHRTLLHDGAAAPVQCENAHSKIHFPLNSYDRTLCASRKLLSPIIPLNFGSNSSTKATVSASWRRCPFSMSLDESDVGCPLPLLECACTMSLSSTSLSCGVRLYSGLVSIGSFRLNGFTPLAAVKYFSALHIGGMAARGAEEHKSIVQSHFSERAKEWDKHDYHRCAQFFQFIRQFLNNSNYWSSRVRDWSSKNIHVTRTTCKA